MALYGPTRRALLQGTLATGALGLTGFPAFADPAWKKYSGTTIEANLIKGPRGDLLQKYASEFTDLTGIKVESEVIPEQQQRQKAVIELTSGKPSFDVVHVSYHVQKRQFEKAGWLADLTGFMKDPNLTAPDLRVDDFSAGGLQFAQNEKGEMHSLPWSVDYFILYYNKEMFAKKGIAVPKTFDEMAAAAEKLNDPANGIYGFTGRGLRNANMTLWTNFFLNYGGEFLDAKGNILTDGPEAIEATKMYQRLMTKSAPPGVAGFNWMESMATLTQGRAAMWIDGVGWAPPSKTPTLRVWSARSATRWFRPAPRASIPPPMATASALPRPAPRRKLPICIASGQYRRPWARGSCRAAAACRSAIRSSTTKRCARASRTRSGWIR